MSGFPTPAESQDALASRDPCLSGDEGHASARRPWETLWKWADGQRRDSTLALRRGRGSTSRFWRAELHPPPPAHEADGNG